MSPNENEDEKKYWVALSTHQKIGARSLMKLWKRFGKISKVWQSTAENLAKAGLDKHQVEAVGEVIRKVDPDHEMARLTKYNIRPMILTDPDYPALLKEIPDPPMILFVRGKLVKTDALSLAVVGSRKYTNYGQQATEELVGPLARAGLTIVSGLALGIDALAHIATLNARGRTVAVLGCGLDQVYPISNLRLADKILASGGAILSEFPLGVPALRHHFPLRNRIIAGLTLGTLVIEGALESGSLITARAALDYNRLVFAVPGSIFEDTSAGPNTLIQMGAKPILNANDILVDLGLETDVIDRENLEIIPDSPEEELVLGLLTEAINFDKIVKQSGLAPDVTNSTLVMLEMKGMITNLGGAIYVRKGKLKK